MLRITNLHKAFGARDIFLGAELQVYGGDRIAIVGPNGSGKTTLFEIITGDQQPDHGDVRLMKQAVVGYLPQETDRMRGRTLLEEVVSVGSAVAQLGRRLAVLEADMAEAEPGRERDRMVEEYGRLQHRYESVGGYSLDHEGKRILGGLGFSEEDHDSMTDSFSGGWLMRIALAKLLLAGPDLLLLDEPTNHLDLESVVWLERFLRSYDGVIMLISHDRDLINAFSNKIVEVRDKKLWSYSGNYESFVAQRQLEIEQTEAAARNQARKVAQTEIFINRFRYKASLASRVQSRIKTLEKLERTAVPSKVRRKMHLSFPDPPRSGRVVMELSDVRFSYGERAVYDSLDLVIERGEKVALVGPNGAGKSTLLKLLAGVLEPQSGERKLGHNVALAYFAQHQIEALVPTNTVLQEVDSAVLAGVDADARRLLGRFLFSGDDADKPIAVLSGGERTRVALAKMLVSPVNLLCMDEPTNHLDMWSRDVLEEALQEYAGAIVLITHDRHLIRNVATRIIEVVDGRVTSYDGGYDYYLEKKERVVGGGEAHPADVPRPRPATGPKTKEQKRVEAHARALTRSLRERVTRIEEELQEVTAELSALETQFAHPEIYASDTDVAALAKRYETGKRRASRLEAAWTEAMESLESAGTP